MNTRRGKRWEFLSKEIIRHYKKNTVARNIVPYGDKRNLAYNHFLMGLVRLQMLVGLGSHKMYLIIWQRTTIWLKRHNKS